MLKHSRCVDKECEVTVRYSTLEAVLDEQLRELCAGELHVARQLPKLIVEVSSAELKSELQKALESCHARLERLERVLKARGSSAERARLRVVDALIGRAADIAEHRGDDLLLDHGIVSVLRHLESYQRSTYESAREVASVLDASDVVETLELDLEEHGRMERYFTVLEEDMLDTIVARRGTGDKATHPWETAAR
jgi:ferritin-like metal-binding protein YciE